MKTLRKLAAIFCALGMLAPSVAMATFGNTFGDRFTWSSNGFVFSASSWPTTSSPIGCFATVQTLIASSIADCVDTGLSNYYAEFRVPVRERDTLRRVSCVATRDTTAGTGSAVLAIYNKDKVSGGSTAVEMATMSISFASAIASGEVRTFDFNVPATYSGFYALGLKTITQGTTTGGFGWNCKAFWEGSS